MSARDIPDWKAAIQAAGSSPPALMALLKLEGLPAEIVLEILCRIVQLLDPQEGEWTLETLVSCEHADIAESLRRKAVTALLNGWTEYVDRYLWEIEAASANPEHLAQQLATFAADLQAAQSSTHLVFSVLSAGCKVPLGGDDWKVMAGNLARHQQALALYTPQLPDAGGDVPRPTPSPRRPK